MKKFSPACNLQHKFQVPEVMFVFPDGKSVLMLASTRQERCLPPAEKVDEKVVKLPFPALGTGFKVPTQSRADYTGITS